MAVTNTFVTPSAPGSRESCHGHVQVGDGVSLDVHQSAPAQAGPGCDPPNLRPCPRAPECTRTSERSDCACAAGTGSVAFADGRAIRH